MGREAAGRVRELRKAQQVPALVERGRVRQNKKRRAEAQKGALIPRAERERTDALAVFGIKRAA